MLKNIGIRGKAVAVPKRPRIQTIAKTLFLRFLGKGGWLAI